MGVTREMDPAATADGGMAAYVPKLLPAWAAVEPGVSYRRMDGSLVMLDVTGFTRLTDRLAARGREGAEELNDILHAVFSSLVGEADDEGADLLKWGGDAILLLLHGGDHAVRAARAAARMQRVLGRVGHLSTSVGRVVLRATTGVHSGPVDLVLSGDPLCHRELVILGPTASTVTRLDAMAQAGQVLLGARTAQALNPRVLGASVDGGRLLSTLPGRPLPRDVPPDDRQQTFTPALLPPQLRAYLAQATREPEHRTVAVAFIRFDGTDTLLAEAGGDALALAVDELVCKVQQATTIHDVAFHETDVDVDGGKVMLIAGAPLSAGDDTDRLLDAMRQIADNPGRIPLRVGIARGRVFTGELGPTVRRTYSVTGNPVNLAARLASKARPGSILVASDVLEHARSSFHVTPLPGLSVKGLDREVQAVALGRPRTTTAAQIPSTLIIGRDVELAMVDGHLDQVRRGHGALVDIVAEPGFGKTRLVEEVIAHAHDLIVLRCDCERTGAAVPYAPIRRLLWELLGITEEHDRLATAEQVRTRVAELDPALTPWLPLLAGVLDIELASGPEIQELAEEYRVARLEQTVLDLLAVALPSPTLIVVEDAHLADQASAGVLARVADATAERPWLLVASRSERSTGWEPTTGHRIDLGPLPTAAAVALAEVATEDAPLPPAMVEALAARAGGHPLFLRELIRAAERGDQLDDLPSSVEALVAVEIDRLSAKERSLLRRAAVLGTSFDTELLTTMLDPDEDTVLKQRVLSRLLQGVNSFLVESRPGRMQFRHVLMREVAYAGLPYRRRRELHLRAAEVLESTTSAATRRPELLALHYFVGGRFEEAWHYGRRAGRRAAERNAPAAAAEAYQRAVEAARRSPDLPALERAADLEALGDALFLSGQSTEAASAYREAFRVERDNPLRAAELTLKQAKVAHRQGKYTVELRRISTALRGLDGVDDSVAVAARARLRTRYAIGRLSQGHYPDARRSAEQAVVDARSSGDHDALARAHLALYEVDFWSGAAETEPHGEIALALFEQLGDLGGQAHTLNNLAGRLIADGRWSEALEMLERAADMFRRIGDAADAANATYNCGDLLVRQGRYGEAAPLLQEALRIARAVGDEELVALAKLEQGRAASRAGRFAEGLALLTDARERFSAMHNEEVVGADVVIAEAHVLAGLANEAQVLVERALETANSIGATWVLPTAQRVLATALLSRDELDRAQEVIEDGLKLTDLPDSGIERGFLLAVAAAVARRSAADHAESLAVEAQEALNALGVARVPIPGEA